MSGRRVRFGDDPDLFPLSSEIFSRGSTQPSNPVYVMPMISPDKWDKAMDEKKKKGGGGKGKQQKKKKDSDDSDESDSDDDDDDTKKKGKGKGKGGGGGGGGDQGKGKGKGGKKGVFNNLTSWQTIVGVVLVLMSVMALGQLKHANQQVTLQQRRLQNLESQIDQFQKQADRRDETNTKLRYKIYTLQMEKYNLEQFVEAPVTVQIANGVGNVFYWLASSVVNAGSGLLGNLGDAMGSVGDGTRKLINHSPSFSGYDDEDLYDEPPNYKPPRYFRNNEPI